MRSLLGSVLLVVIVFALLSGCGIERAAIDPVGYRSIRQGDEITEEDAEQIVDGQTTKDDVYLMFGKPSEIVEDGHVFVYNWVRGSKANVLGLGSGSAKAHCLIITFDDDRIVTGHKITRGDVPIDYLTDTTIGEK